jgi:hypothetical protein
MIRKYKYHFYRSYDYYDDSFNCTSNDVIKEIESARNKKDDNYKIEVRDIDDEINLVKIYIEDNKKCLKESEEEKNAHFEKIYNEQWRELHSQLTDMEQAKKDGLNKVCVIEFGDGHGHIKGGNVGRAMDYSGRYIKLNKSDFVVFTSNCH